MPKAVRQRVGFRIETERCYRDVMRGRNFVGGLSVEVFVERVYKLKEGV